MVHQADLLGHLHKELTKVCKFILEQKSKSSHLNELRLAWIKPLINPKPTIHTNPMSIIGYTTTHFLSTNILHQVIIIAIGVLTHSSQLVKLLF